MYRLKFLLLSLFIFGVQIGANHQIEPSTLYLTNDEEGHLIWGYLRGGETIEVGNYALRPLKSAFPLPENGQVVHGAPFGFQHDGQMIVGRCMLDLERNSSIISWLLATYPSELSLGTGFVNDELPFLLEDQPEIGVIEDDVWIVWVHGSEPMGMFLQDDLSWSSVVAVDWSAYEYLIDQKMVLSEEDLALVQERTDQYDGPFGLVQSIPPCPYILKTHDSGYPPEKVYNFIITCDGFTAAEQSLFFDYAQILTDYLLIQNPFFTHKSYFNVYAVGFSSMQSGYDSSVHVDDHDTVFGAFKTPNTTIVQTRIDAIEYVREVLGGTPVDTNYYGWVIFNPPQGEQIGTPPWDTHGVPIGPEGLNLCATLHEFLHTDGWRLGDHELHNRYPLAANTTDQMAFDPGDNHPWQAWFDWYRPGSRLLRTTAAFRDGLDEWVTEGGTYHTYDQVADHPYDTDRNAPGYVSAMDLLQFNLWESEFVDVPSLNQKPQFRPFWSCAMNSQRYMGPLFCPVCVEQIVRTLFYHASRPFSLHQLQTTTGDYLEIVVSKPISCSGTQVVKNVDLSQSVFLNSNPVAVLHSYKVSDGNGMEYDVSRYDLSNMRISGGTNRLEIRAPGNSDTEIWLPGIQILNQNGLRIPVQIIDEQVLSTLIEQLSDHCNFEFYDLKNKPLQIEFWCD